MFLDPPPWVYPHMKSNGQMSRSQLKTPQELFHWFLFADEKTEANRRLHAVQEERPLLQASLLFLPAPQCNHEFP